MIAGVIQKILTQKENDWGRYQLDCFGKDMLAVGVIQSPSIGMRVTLEGHEERNKYGKQFKISKVLATENDTFPGIRRFLCDGYIKGIGITKANAIIEKFGKESLDLFDTAEGRKKLCSVKGLSKISVEKAYQSYLENEPFKDIVMFLNGSGTKAQVETIYEKYGKNAVKVLKDNPYRLQMDLDGFGFLKTDAIALASGIKKDSVYRIMAAAKYSLEEASMSGHCYLTYEEIKETVIPLLVPVPKCNDKGIPEKAVVNVMDDWDEKKEEFIKKYNVSAEDTELLAQAVETRQHIGKGLVDAIRIALEDKDFVNYNDRIYTKKIYDVEIGVAQMINDMLSKSPIRNINPGIIEKAISDVEERKTKAFMEEGKNISFQATDEQRKAVELASSNRISIISGGPGRGKTAISEMVAHAFLLCGQSYDKRDIIMIAPTGRAAQRITESTGYMAMTAHRAIMMQKQTGIPEGKLILCDESSMVDIFLANSILNFSRKSNLIFVGDVDQIASVGPGKVLKDMIDSEIIPFILLKEGHRNSGSIAHNATLINAGVKMSGYCYDEHFVYTHASVEETVERDTNGDIIGTIIPMMETVVADYKEKVKQYGITNVMLCSAMKERGVVSVNKLNLRLQNEYTKGKNQATYGNKTFREGDRVMQTTNDYNFIKKSGNELINGVFNGEKGTIAKILPDPENESKKMVIVFDDGTIGGYTKNTAQNLTLAYATTLHKCQGSEAACMMMTYTYADYMLLNRSLFYTGETRAKKEFRFYGEEQVRYGKNLSAFDIAVSKTDDIKRNTSLCDMLKEL